MNTPLLASALVLVLAAPVARAQDRPPAPAQAPAPPASAAVPSPPPLLARADVARTYAFALLRKGPNWTPQATPAVRALQDQHLANITRLAQEGQLLVAGPCGDGDLRGVFIFATESLDEARALADSDPMVKAGRLRVELHKFLGSPGIGRRTQEQARSGAKPEMVGYQLALARLGPRFNPAEGQENRALLMARNQWLQQVEAGGQLPLSGPFLDGGEIKGLLVFKAESIEAARKLLDADPAAVTQRFTYDLEPWWLAKGAID